MNRIKQLLDSFSSVFLNVTSPNSLMRDSSIISGPSNDCSQNKKVRFRKTIIHFVLFHQRHIFLRKSNLSILIQRTSFLPESVMSRRWRISIFESNQKADMSRDRLKVNDPRWWGKTGEREEYDEKPIWMASWTKDVGAGSFVTTSVLSLPVQRRRIVALLRRPYVLTTRLSVTDLDICSG